MRPDPECGWSRAGPNLEIQITGALRFRQIHARYLKDLPLADGGKVLLDELLGSCRRRLDLGRLFLLEIHGPDGKHHRPTRIVGGAVKRLNLDLDVKPSASLCGR